MPLMSPADTSVVLKRTAPGRLFILVLDWASSVALVFSASTPTRWPASEMFISGFFRLRSKQAREPDSSGSTFVQGPLGRVTARLKSLKRSVRTLAPRWATNWFTDSRPCKTFEIRGTFGATSSGPELTPGLSWYRRPYELCVSLRAVLALAAMSAHVSAIRWIDRQWFMFAFG